MPTARSPSTGRPPTLHPGPRPTTGTSTTAPATLPGQAPDYPNAVYVGLITYAFGTNGVPFVGTADAIEDNEQACPC